MANTTYYSAINQVVDHSWQALNYLLAKQGGACVIVNSSWCTWINNTQQVEVNICEIYNQAKWLHLFGEAHSNAQDVWNIIKGFTPLTGPLTTTALNLKKLQKTHSAPLKNEKQKQKRGDLFPHNRPMWPGWNPYPALTLDLWETGWL